MMKNINPFHLFLAFVFSATALLSSNMLSAQGREAQMAHFLKSYQDAYNAQNLDSLMTHYSQEASKVLSDGKALKDARHIKEVYQEAFATKPMTKIYTLSNLTENERGDVSLRGTYTAQGAYEEDAYISRSGGFTCEIRMEGEEWKIIRWESFPLIKVLSMFRVLDYHSWAAAYEVSTFRQIRKASGEFTAEVGGIEGDSTSTYVISTWRSQAEFDRFSTNKDAASLMQRAGALGEARSMVMVERTAKP